MAKDKERQLAEYYYIDKNRTAKEVAILVGVTEATVGGWVQKHGWRAQRDARALSSSSRNENIVQVVSGLAQERVALSRELDAVLARGDVAQANDIRKQLSAIDDGAAKWNKTLLSATKDGRITLTVYLEVMERIFNALRRYDEALYLRSVDFQDAHVREVSINSDKL